MLKRQIDDVEPEAAEKRKKSTPERNRGVEEDALSEMNSSVMNSQSSSVKKESSAQSSYINTVSPISQSSSSNIQIENVAMKQESEPQIAASSGNSTAFSTLSENSIPDDTIRIKLEPYSRESDSDDSCTIEKIIINFSKGNRPRPCVKRKKSDDDIICLGEFPSQRIQEKEVVDVENEINLKCEKNNSICSLKIKNGNLSQDNKNVNNSIADVENSVLCQQPKTHDAIVDNVNNSKESDTGIFSENNADNISKKSNVEKGVEDHFNWAMKQKEGNTFVNGCAIKTEITEDMDVHTENDFSANNVMRNNANSVENIVGKDIISSNISDMSIKQKVDDIVTMSNCVIKKEVDTDMDVETEHNLREDNVFQNCERSIEKNVNSTGMSELNIKLNEANSVILTNCAIKKEADENMDVDSENNRRDNVSVNGVNVLENGESNLLKDANNILINSVYVKQENDVEDTLNDENSNLEVVKDGLKYPFVSIKVEKACEKPCPVVSNGTTELNSKNNAISQALVTEDMEPLQSSNLNKLQVDPIFSSDSGKQFDFNCLNKKDVHRSDVITDDEELCDTAPSSPVLENDQDDYELTLEELACLSCSLTGAAPSLPQKTQSNEEVTVSKTGISCLNVLDLKSKVDYVDLFNCSLVLAIIAKRLEVCCNTNSTPNKMSFEERIKNVFSIYHEDGADVTPDCGPKKVSKSSAEECSSRVSETSSGRYSPVYSLSHGKLAVYETPETEGFDPNALKCLEGWEKEDIRMVIPVVPLSLHNGTSQAAGNEPTQSLSSEQLQSPVGNSIRTTGNTFQRKRSYPESECLEPVKSLPTYDPVSDTVVITKSFRESNTEIPNKMQRNDAMTSEFSDNMSERVNPGLINDPLRFSSQEEDRFLAFEPKTRHTGGKIKDLRELLNRKMML